MAEENLTEEDVFNDDKDPLEAIREIRKAEGKEVDEDFESSVEHDTSAEDSADNKDADAQDKDDLSEFEEPADINENQNTVSDEDKSDTQQQKASQDETGDEDDGEELQEEEEAKAEVDKAPATRKFKANGQEFEFTEEEIMQQFETVFGQAMNYTQKMQKIAPYRKMISALEQEGLTQDQLNIAIDALKGDKGALAQIIKAHGIESMDLDEHDDTTNPYQPTQYGKDEVALNIEDVQTRIRGDKEYAITVDVIGNQWDDTSRDAFSSNPQLILGLHNDIKSGKYDQVAPLAMKMKVLDGSGKSDIEYYMAAGEQITRQEAEQAQQQEQQQAAQQKTDDLNQQTQSEVAKNEAASSAAQRKRSASSTRTRADRQGVIDYLDDDDTKFDEWYNNLMKSN